ncbi:MAG: hypothetical protein NVS3B5_06650 [Sphingomicrobium sp.]
MATVTTGLPVQAERGYTLSVTRILIAGAGTATLVFVLCRVGTFLSFASPMHAYIRLFTNADFSSGRALAEGTCYSLVFGALVGAIFAVVYNATASLDRK